jgi:kynureninase
MIHAKKGHRKVTRTWNICHDWQVVDGELKNLHAPFCFWCGQGLLNLGGGRWDCMACAAEYEDKDFPRPTEEGSQRR